MFACAKSSKAFRVTATALAAAALATCAVTVSTHESAAPTSMQLAERTNFVPMDDGFHW